MRVGYFSLNTAEGIRPDVSPPPAFELEQRGFDSLWLPEHSHIPVVREPTPAFGEDVPEAYPHLMDPFVSLASAVTSTSSLLLGTGVSMVLEHDVLDLGCRLATLDVLSGGRIRFGIGAGWLREELRNVRPDVPFSARYQALAERVEALRTIWSEDEPEFHGRWDRFDRSWVYPKPLQRPLPIGFGLSGELGIRYAAELADEWYPIDAILQMHGGVGAAIDKFRRAVKDVGRDPASVPVTIFAWGFEPGNPSVDLLRSYEEHGIERVVVAPSTMKRHSSDVTLTRLDEFTELASRA